MTNGKMDWVNDALAFAVARTRENAERVTDFPEAAKNGAWEYARNKPGGWVGGHWTGLLWLAFAQTGDPFFERAAREWTTKLAPRQNDTSTHDLGFLFELSHVLGAQLTGDTSLNAPAAQAARSLIQRYNEKGKFIRAWGALNAEQNRGRAIIDTLMNLDLLYWATRETGEQVFAEIATAHARTALKYQVRADWSTSHTMDFNAETGAFLAQDTHQGLSASSCWARGQAWAVYGCAETYRNTGDAIFLDAARNLAEYALRRAPADRVPFWDYDSPLIPNDVRDSSAAAILAAGLLILADQDRANAARWRDEATTILKSLWENYSSRGTNEPSILIHATRSKPHGAMDSGLIYGDFYFVEALTDLKRDSQAHALRITYHTKNPTMIDSNLPRTFALDPRALVAVKNRIASGDRAFDAPLAQLRREADRALGEGPWSVVDKPIAPPSGDKHDYLSLARYFWRNPNTPDGLPYVLRDGEVNPEIWTIPDHKSFDSLMDNVLTLGLAYYFTDEPRYAEYAAQLLRVWFLDDATRMNPHLNFTQGVRGASVGRHAGIIETRELAQVVDAIGLLAGSTAWAENDQRAMIEWCARFLDWLLRSELGRREAQQRNNHGTFYDAQVIALAFFVGDAVTARRFLERATTERIPQQIDPNGIQRFELARTLAWHYHVFNLQAHYRLASFGERVGMDIWNFATPDGRSLRAATDFLVPYVAGKPWEYPQIAPQEFGVLFFLLCQASVKYRDPDYYRAALQSPGVARASHRAHLLLALG
jgi:hypothetical protein